jgi:hypothetical protein
MMVHCKVRLNDSMQIVSFFFYVNFNLIRFIPVSPFYLHVNRESVLVLNTAEIMVN